MLEDCIVNPLFEASACVGTMPSASVQSTVSSDQTGAQDLPELDEMDEQAVSKVNSGGKAFQANGSTLVKNRSRERRPSLEEPCLNTNDGTLVRDGAGGVTRSHKGWLWKF